jgi:N-acetylmuramoyl-L-alanine amidase
MTALTPWLTEAGKYPVEHVNCPHFSQLVELDKPPAGVLHTTEGGSWSGLDSEFEQHFAPHFLVGPHRIQQLVPIGYIGAALVTHNWLARVQIEVVSNSQETLWIFDDPTLDPLAELMKACFLEYGIPLTHPWPDGDWGRAGDNPHRHSGKFGTVAGWYSHGDCPLPDRHWDCGNLQWSVLLKAAQDKIPLPRRP